MAYSSKRSQEERRGFIDPRTKLALILILAVFVMGGLGGSQMKPLKMVLSALPFILLLDEPTSGLDYGHMKETALLLKKLQKMGTTILVVTHDTELIRHCCTRMISQDSILQKIR